MNNLKSKLKKSKKVLEKMYFNLEKIKNSLGLYPIGYDPSLEEIFDGYENAIGGLVQLDEAIESKLEIV